MKCINCGNDIPKGASYCEYCGAKVQVAQPINQGIPTYQPVYSQPTNPEDKKSVGLGILGFFIPVVGLILYIVLKSENPKKAKSAGKGALIGFILSIIFSIVISIAGIFGFTTLVTNPDFESRVEEFLYNFGDGLDYDDYDWDEGEYYPDVTLGALVIEKENGVTKTGLIVTVSNDSEETISMNIEVEALDDNYESLMTDIGEVTNLGPQETVELVLFKDIPENMLEQMKRASFGITEENLIEPTLE